MQSGYKIDDEERLPVVEELILVDGQKLTVARQPAGQRIAEGEDAGFFVGWFSHQWGKWRCCRRQSQ